MTAKGYRISFWGNKNALKLAVVMIACICEYMKNNYIL